MGSAKQHDTLSNIIYLYFSLLFFAAFLLSCFFQSPVSSAFFFPAACDTFFLLKKKSKRLQHPRCVLKKTWKAFKYRRERRHQVVIFHSLSKQILVSLVEMMEAFATQPLVAANVNTLNCTGTYDRRGLCCSGFSEREGNSIGLMVRLLPNNK